MATDLTRFHEAQRWSYARALEEIRGGEKQSHWIWYVFPQVEGLGRSDKAQLYSIQSLDEAQAYVDDEVLFGRLVEISQALLGLPTDDPVEVMGSIDARKLRSSMTLFELAAEGREEASVFTAVLDKFYQGKRCRTTQETVARWRAGGSRR